MLQVYFQLYVGGVTLDKSINERWIFHWLFGLYYYLWESRMGWIKDIANNTISLDMSPNIKTNKISIICHNPFFFLHLLSDNIYYVVGWYYVPHGIFVRMLCRNEIIDKLMGKSIQVIMYAICLSKFFFCLFIIPKFQIPSSRLHLLFTMTFI